MDIKNMVNILCQDKGVIHDLGRFVSAFELWSVTTSNQMTSYSNGTMTRRELITRVLELWFGRNGVMANIQSLCRILEENEFVFAAETLRAEYSKVLPSTPRRRSTEVVATTTPGLSTPVQPVPAVSILTLGSLPPHSSTQGKSQQRLERYKKWSQHKVVDFLGSGSFGYVFKIENTLKGTSAKTAVKIIVDVDQNPADAGSCELIQTNTELQAMISLPQHDNVVQLIDKDVLFPSENATPILQIYGDQVNVAGRVHHKVEGNYRTLVYLSNKLHTFVMEMELCGHSLYKWTHLPGTFNKFKLQSKEFVRFQYDIAQGIINGLKHVHDKGMMHRDLKPENIYFHYDANSDGYSLPVKIGDFGLTKQMSGTLGVTKTAPKGTLIYRAPEVGSGRYGPQADLYSLGLVLWELFEIDPHSNHGQLEHRFKQLSIEGKIDLIQKNSFVPNLVNTIFNLTRYTEVSRTKSIHDVSLEFVSQNGVMDTDEGLC